MQNYDFRSRIWDRERNNQINYTPKEDSKHKMRI